MNASNRYTERLAMDRNNPIHVDIEPQNVGFEIDRLWIGTLGGSAPGASGVWTSASISSFSLRR
jgi:hypothetical protein